MSEEQTSLKSISLEELPEAPPLVFAAPKSARLQQENDKLAQSSSVTTFCWATTRAEWTRRPEGQEQPTKYAAVSASQVYKMARENKVMDETPVKLADVISCLTEIWE